MNHDRIAQRIQSHIDADPWRITVYEPGREPGIDDESAYSFEGRLYPAGSQGRAYYHQSPAGVGSPGVGDYLWLLLVPKDTKVPATNTTIRAVHSASNQDKRFQVLFAIWQPSHQQVLLQEMQP